MIEQCPQLIAKIQERNGTPTQNVQMIAAEKRPAQPLMLLQGVELRRRCRIRGNNLMRLGSVRPQRKFQPLMLDEKKEHLWNLSKTLLIREHQ